MPDERAAMDRVGRYWDALVLGVDAANIDLEPELAAAIRRVHALGAKPPATAKERVWREVLGNVEAAEANGGSPTLHAITPDDLQFPTSFGPMPREAPSWARRPRWALAQLATAALIALVLAGSILILRPGQFNRQEEPPAYVPAISATPATPEVADQPVAEFLWKSDGSPDLPFGEPAQLAIDPEGNLWVPDGQNDVIQIYAPDGTFLETWGTPGSGEGEFQFTTGAGIGQGAVDFDAAGNIYVADTGNSRIQKFAPDRTFITAWGSQGTQDGQFLNAVDVAVDQQGRVFVSEGTLGKIEVFDSEGTWLETLATFGLEAGGVAGPGGLAIDGEGNLWVTEIGSVRAQKFSPDGESLLTIGRRGADDGEFAIPTAVAIDAQGRVFVADRGLNRVQVFSPNGAFLGSWGESGNEDGQFSGSYGLALDGRGNVYVSEDVNLRVQAFRLLPPFAPESEAIIVGTPEAAEAPVAEFLWQSEGDPGLPLADPTNLAIAPDGNIWVTDGRNNRFQIFSPGGEFLEAWGTPGEGEGELDFVEPTLFGGYGAGSMAFDAAGNLYVADPGNYRIQKFGLDRSFITAWGSQGSGEGQFRWPGRIVLDEWGRVYVSDEMRGDVQVFDGEGKYLQTIGSFGQGEGQFNFPTAVASDSAGSIWVADTGHDRMQQFSATGALQAAWGKPGYADGDFINITDIAIDGQDRLFVLDGGAERVKVFAPDGTFLGAWGSAGNDPGAFLTPSGVVLDGQGNAYVSDFGNARVQKFRLLPPLAACAGTCGEA